jgi:hypothetical protein
MVPGWIIAIREVMMSDPIEWLKLDSETILQIMEDDLAAQKQRWEQTAHAMDEASVAAVQSMDQFADALRQFNEATMTQYVLWQGFPGDIIDPLQYTVHYETLAEAENAIDLPHAMIVQSDHYPLRPDEPRQYPIRVYEGGDLVATLHNDQQWADWMTGALR